MFVLFDPQPAASELPTRVPTPFRPGTPHPLALRAALDCQDFVSAHPKLSPADFAGRFGGKMLGVLVAVDAEGRAGYLRGFAGKLGGDWELEGFVPPLFDSSEFSRLWDAGAPQITRHDTHTAEARQAHARAPSAQTQAELQAANAAQRAASHALHAELYATYQVPNARGERRPLVELFAPRSPPGGSGDCAAPKLIAHAYRLGLRPLALAEFWWGQPPPAGARLSGVFYPACRGRCAKILPFMLEGLVVEPAPDFGIHPVPDDAPRTIFEDEAMIVVDKPNGLLSVPGRGPNRQDCVERRLQTRCKLPDDTWPRLVHRLDLATSGLLIAAKSRDDYVALQQQFSRRSIEKRYIAVLEGELAQASGDVQLPLGRDLDDRPRQMHDPRKGKAAVTRYKTLSCDKGRTRVELHPLTGRTHQLRLHAAHAQGLNAPIVGDWIYGFGGERLLLHAECIKFLHPRTGEEIELHSPCPF